MGCKAVIWTYYIVFIYNVIQYIYRDGVSEGQFYQVLLYELDAIRKVYLEILQLFIFTMTYSDA